MIAYIEKIVTALIDLLRFPLKPPLHTRLQDVAGRLAVLAEELNRLDPRDFPAAVQFDFVEARRLVRTLALLPQDHWERHARALRDASEDQRTDDMQRYSKIFRDALAVCEQVLHVLEAHGGVSARTGRSFAFVRDSKLRPGIERDYHELAQVLLPGGAWKSAVVLAGSILEAILYDQLTADASHVARAMASPRAPRKPSGAVRNITGNGGDDVWALADLVRVAVDIGLLPAARSEVLDPAVRHYRQLLLPRREVLTLQASTEADALLAKGGLDAICNHLMPSSDNHS
jgi:hypothetical protein